MASDIVLKSRFKRSIFSNLLEEQWFRRAESSRRRDNFFGRAIC